MSKDDQTIMTVPVFKLFGENNEMHFQGFIDTSKENYEQIILDNFEWSRRGNAEIDKSRKQPIAYCLIMNPLSREIYAYQRAGNEDRLVGLLSLGFGGHIEKEDLKENENPLYESLKRELEEELEMSVRPDFSVVGYINDDSNDVGKVHFGLLYLAGIDTRDIKTRGDEASFAKLMHLSELEKILSSGKFESKEFELEPWSKIAYPISVPIIESKRKTLFSDILRNSNKHGRGDSDLLEKVKNNVDSIELREREVVDCGMSFEPRSRLTYDVLLENKLIGIYEETRIYEKDFTPCCSFGEFN